MESSHKASELDWKKQPQNKAVINVCRGCWSGQWKDLHWLWGFRRITHYIWYSLNAKNFIPIMSVGKEEPIDSKPQKTYFLLEKKLT